MVARTDIGTGRQWYRWTVVQADGGTGRQSYKQRGSVHAACAPHSVGACSFTYSLFLGFSANMSRMTAERAVQVPNALEATPVAVV